MTFKIPLIKPYITEKEIEAVTKVLKTGYLTEGPVTREFEQACKEYIDCKYAIAFTSNTTGMETALRALEIGTGDEVIVPNYTYPATADVVEIVGAKTVLVDVDRKTGNIDYDEIKKAITDKTKAIIPVSLFGNPLDYDRLNEIKQKYGVYIIEDSACSIGAKFKDKMVGNLADISIFSFHPRKFITTGEGGLVTTNNTELAEFMTSYKNFGMKTIASRDDIKFSSTEFIRIGTNYKMSNVLAAIGLEQIKIIDKLLEKREELCARYTKLLKDVEDVKLFERTENSKHSWQSFCILIENRDEIMKKMREKGIEVQIGTFALHMHPAFKNMKKIGNLNNSKYLFEHCLTLPLYHDMTEEEQDLVVEELKNLIKMKK